MNFAVNAFMIMAYDLGYVVVIADTYESMHCNHDISPKEYLHQ
jgi:hypothetical protein